MIHLPPGTVALQSAPEVKLAHLIVRLRQQLPPHMVANVHSEKKETPAPMNDFAEGREDPREQKTVFDQGVQIHDVKTDLIYVPEMRIDDLRVVGDVDCYAEEMLIDILSAFERGEREYLSDGA